MSRLNTLQECDQAIQELLPDLPRPEQKALASLVTGVVLEQSVVLSKASAGVPGPAQDRSKQRRAQRLLANSRLEVARAQRRLLEHILRRREGRLDLFFDATTTGATANYGGTVTLCLAIGWHRRALPLVWRSFKADDPEQNWRAATKEMLETVQKHLPPETQVVLMADRGLTGSPLANLVKTLGWHYLLRVTRNTGVYQDENCVQPIKSFALTPGSQCCLCQVRVWPPRQKGDRWVTQWNRADLTNVVAVWRSGDEEPWLLVTDLPATLARCSEYRRRTWEEELFRDLKSYGWNWQASRVRLPERVDRLLLVMALATLWVLATSQRVLGKGLRRLIEEPSRRCYSRFQLGLRWIKRLIANDQTAHCYFNLWAENSASLKLS